MSHGKHGSAVPKVRREDSERAWVEETQQWRRTSSENALNSCWHDMLCSTIASVFEFDGGTLSGTDTCSRGKSAESLEGAAGASSTSRSTSFTMSSSLAGTRKCWYGAPACGPGAYETGGLPVVLYATRYASIRSSYGSGVAGVGLACVPTR